MHIYKMKKEIVNLVLTHHKNKMVFKESSQGLANITLNSCSDVKNNQNDQYFGIVKINLIKGVKKYFIKG